MRIVIVGGFLGAGKTTLLHAACRKLRERGMRVGLVTNDQAPELVDTALLQGLGSPVEEIAGSCFCCNFDGFARALGALAEKDVDIVLAEPVGSCTDLAATIVRPLISLHPEYHVAPLTVLVDSSRLLEAFGKAESTVDPDALYIYRKQLEEADLCLLAKADTLDPAARAAVGVLPPDERRRFVSAVTGEGVDEWLQEVTTSTASGATRIEVDYDRYAHGEAVLGWLNATYALAGDGETDAARLVEGVVRRVHRAAQGEGIEIGHVKAVATIGGRSAAANATSLRGTVEVRELPALGREGSLTLNARVQTSPERLTTIAEEAIAGIGAEATAVTCRALTALTPGRPVPTHRM